MLKTLIGNNVRSLRTTKQISRKDLAESAGKLDEAYIGYLERGQKNSTIGTLRRIADALDVELIEFFRESKDNPNAFPTLDRFLHNSLPKYEVLTAQEVLEQVGTVLLDHVTIEKIEENSLEAMASSFWFFPDQQYTSLYLKHDIQFYTLAWSYDYWYGTHHGKAPSISCDVDKLNEFVKILIQLHPVEWQIEEIIYDFLLS